MCSTPNLHRHLMNASCCDAGEGRSDSGKVLAWSSSCRQGQNDPAPSSLGRRFFPNLEGIQNTQTEEYMILEAIAPVRCDKKKCESI